jgi:hypothetical protein
MFADIMVCFIQLRYNMTKIIQFGIHAVIYGPITDHIEQCRIKLKFKQA